MDLVLIIINANNREQPRTSTHNLVLEQPKKTENITVHIIMGNIFIIYV